MNYVRIRCKVHAYLSCAFLKKHNKKRRDKPVFFNLKSVFRVYTHSVQNSNDSNAYVAENGKPHICDTEC